MTQVHPAGWLTKVEEGIEHMEFLPGLFNGKPVPMEYVKPIYITRAGG
jgi:hypothetical protein